MQLSINSGNTVYVIDTSALIVLDITFKYDNPVFTAIWEEIEELIGQGSFRTIDFVEDEINSYQGNEDFIKKWIKKWKKHLVVETDANCITEAIPIINDQYNTGFFDSKKLAAGKDEADPYLISYCKINNCTLITCESKVKPNKIPAVAKKYGVNCIDINEFLMERELKMERKKR